MNVECDFVVESADSLSIDVSQGVDKSKYDAYVSECKERGFTVEVDETSDSYEAFNAEGYQLRLSYLDYSSPSMDIHLDAPKAVGKLTWPDYGLALLLPNPNKEIGSVATDSATQFTAYVGGISREEYDAYAEACRDLGFTEDHSKGDDYYRAEDAKGNKLDLEFRGFNTMYVSLSGATTPKSSDEEGLETTDAEEVEEEKSQDAEPASAPESAADNASSERGSIEEGAKDGDFKEMMDSYEKFMDEYIDFMVKYQDEGSPASMLIDYGKMMASYTEWVLKIDSIDYDSLTEEEANYANEVITRVTKKLNDAAIEVA